MGLKGTCILRDYMYVAQDPVDQLLLGPAYGIGRLLERAGLTVADIDVWEIHEAFAGQVLANLEALKTEEFCQKSIGVKSVVGEVPMEKLTISQRGCRCSQPGSLHVCEGGGLIFCLQPGSSHGYC